MPTPTPCHDAFTAGQAFRQNVPLSAGAYKIGDAMRRLARLRRCVETIADKVKRGEKFRAYEDLHCCLGHERGAYLKDMPKLIANALGEAILPGIAELAADGVSPSEVVRAYGQAERDVQALLWDCEKAHQRLGQGISHEYTAMRQRGSHLLELLRQAEAIGQRALDLVDAHNAAA